MHKLNCCYETEILAAATSSNAGWDLHQWNSASAVTQDPRHAPLKKKSKSIYNVVLNSSTTK